MNSLRVLESKLQKKLIKLDKWARLRQIKFTMVRYSIINLSGYQKESFRLFIYTERF